MSTFVVDASVIVKWLVPETGSAQARLLARQNHRLLSPALFYAEVANTLWKKHRSGELPAGAARAAVALASRAPLETVDCGSLLVQAFDLAVMLERTVYDSLYLALALRERCQLVTADARFHRAITPALPGSTVLLGDL